jgi:DNA mismatch repair protein MutS
MAGKSTYMRQVALIVILAQIGSFVPAKSAKIGIVDNIFTRVGASDDLMAGKSTFMTEMLEVSSILKHATKRSLIILDEVGRGTSTFDGMSIAQAVIEYIALKIGAKTMFATHYHELTDLEGQIPGLKNFTIAVKKRKDEIIFLRKIIEGPADGSYGIDVAKLADLPKEVLKRARTVLHDLEKIDFGTREIRVGEIDDFDEQTTLEDNAKEDIINELKLIEPYSMNPIEALSYLNELKERVKTL